MPEEVNHPSHYNAGTMEVIDAIEGLKLGFCAGNVLKYLARHEYKGSPMKDLLKAKWYLERLIKNLEKDLKSGVDQQEAESVLRSQDLSEYALDQELPG